MCTIDVYSKVRPEERVGPEGTMTARVSRRLLTGGVAALLLGYAAPAAADWGLCSQLQADFMAVDRQASSDPGNADHLGQQLDSARSAARRAGCTNFLFFGPKPSRNCPQIMAHVNQLEQAFANAGGLGFAGFGRRQAGFRRNELRDQLLAYGCAVP